MQEGGGGGLKTGRKQHLQNESVSTLSEKYKKMNPINQGSWPF